MNKHNVHQLGQMQKPCLWSEKSPKIGKYMKIHQMTVGKALFFFCAVIISGFISDPSIQLRAQPAEPDAFDEPTTIIPKKKEEPLGTTPSVPTLKSQLKSAGPDIQAHPLYRYLTETYMNREFHRLFLGFHFSALQPSGNFTFPVTVPRGGLVPSVGMDAEFWLTKKFGARLRWTKALLAFFPAGDPLNSSFKVIDTFNPEIVYRVYFQVTRNDSYFQVGAGWHQFDLDLVTEPGVPFVKYNEGPFLSLERKIALHRRLGLRGTVDLITLTLARVYDESMIKTRWNYGFHFAIEGYVVVLSEEGLETQVSLIYSQQDYLYRVTGNFESQFRYSMFEQQMRSIRLQFATLF